MFRKIILWLYARISMLAMHFLYGPWSRFWRWAFERKYKYLPATFPWATKKLMDFFRKCEWTKDKWYLGFDVISKPEKFWALKKGDCDEFASFAAVALPGQTKWILSVTWYVPGKGKKFYGHNVCMYPRIVDPLKVHWWHISNWGKIGPFESMYDLIESIPKYKRDHKDAIPCAWGVRPADTLKFRFGGYFTNGRANGRRSQEG